MAKGKKAQDSHDDVLRTPKNKQRTIVEMLSGQKGKDKARQALADTTNAQVTRSSGRQVRPRRKISSGSEETVEDISSVVGLVSTEEKVEHIKEESMEVEHKEESNVKHSSKDSLSDGLSEYERIRAENIRQREKLFAELNFEETKQELTPSSAGVSSAKASMRGIATQKRETVKEVLPLRKSSRLSGGKVAEIQRFVPDEPEQESRSIIECKTLSVSECLVPPASNSHLLTSLSSLQSSHTTANSEVDFGRLSIVPEGVAKVVPERIFSVVFHPGTEKIVTACGDKWGKVGLWDCQDTEGSTHGVHLFSYHSRPVNCLTWDTANSNCLISTSYDGTSRVLDAGRQEARFLYWDEEFLEDDGWTSFHCQPDPHTFLISQGKAGSVVRVDPRVGVGAVATYRLFSNVHAKSISSHPLQPNLLMAGHNKGSAFIFDLRSGENNSGKVCTPVCELLGATKAITSCQFSPISGSQVVTVANDDKIRLYCTDNLSKQIKPQSQVKHNNQTGRWLTPFRAAWHPNRDDLLATGSMERPRQIEMWSTKSGTLNLQHKLQGESLGSVSSLVSIHPYRNILVGANSSGRLHIFM